MAASLSPKTWFITGASSGFGLAFARHALARGDTVVACARTPKKLESFVAEAPDRILAVELDVTKPEDALPAVACAIARFGKIDILINNAGYGYVGAVEETPEEDLRAQFETNFFGAVSVIKAVLPFLRQQRSGAIVNISSLGGQISMAGFGAYCASKFALEGLSEALAQEVAPFGIKVLIVEPGAFRTDFASPQAMKSAPPLDAYLDIVGETRQFAQGMNGTQAGDPAKAAAAIVQALEAEITPLRLQLGPDAVSLVRAHSEHLLSELTTWEHVALNTTFDSETTSS